MVHATLYEWFGARDEDRAQGRACERARAGTGAGSRQRRTWLAPARCRCRGATTRPTQEFEQAIRLNPNLFDAYYCYARTAFAQGEIARSADLFKQGGGRSAGRFPEPDAAGAVAARCSGAAEEAAKANREGIRRAERILALNPTTAGRCRSDRARCCRMVSMRGRWRGRSDRWSCITTDPSTLMNGACLQAKLGHKEEALDLLERVFARG